MHRFYVPGLASEGEVRLPDEEVHHLSRVLRLQSGESVVLFDGNGREVAARIERVDSRHVTARILEERQALAEPSVRIVLAQAVLKGDKTEDVVRDAVMLGVSAVQPFLSRRSEVSRKAAVAREDRWRRTALSSVKQCGRAVLPDVMDVRLFEEVLSVHAGALRLMFVEPSAGQVSELNSLRMLHEVPSTDVVLFVGPEGGWDSAEIQSAAAAGVTLVSFGRRTLRADAAGAAALAILQFLWEKH